MRYVVVFLTVLVVSSAWSQCEQVLFKGKVQDTIRPQGFYNMMVVNRTSGKGVFGQPNGTFSVYVNDMDSITISVKGYKMIQYVIDADSNCQDTRYFYVEGKPQEVAEVIVKPIKTLDQIREERESLALRETRMVTGMEVIQSPITALYQAFSKKERSKRTVAELQYLDSQREIVRQLLRTYVAYDVVDLSEEEFDEFIFFLNVSPDFLRTATEWELIEFIKGKYEHFKLLKNQERIEGE